MRLIVSLCKVLLDSYEETSFSNDQKLISMSYRFIKFIRNLVLKNFGITNLQI